MAWMGNIFTLCNLVFFFCKMIKHLPNSSAQWVINRCLWAFYWRWLIVCSFVYTALRSQWASCTHLPRMHACIIKASEPVPYTDGPLSLYFWDMYWVPAMCIILCFSTHLVYRSPPPHCPRHPRLSSHTSFFPVLKQLYPYMKADLLFLS